MSGLFIFKSARFLVHRKNLLHLYPFKSLIFLLAHWLLSGASLAIEGARKLNSHL